jgi:hypothetical protein
MLVCTSQSIFDSTDFRYPLLRLAQAENVNGCLLFDTKILLDWNEAILTVHLVIYFAA